VRVAPAEQSKVIASLQPPSGEKGERLPAIVTSTFGKGRVVYFAAGFDAANYNYSYPYHRLLLKNAIDWAAMTAQPISVEAPMCVHAVPMRQTKNGERLIVHLYNDVNTTANHARPDDDIPLREETLPIHDIRVSFRDYKLGRTHLEPWRPRSAKKIRRSKRRRSSFRAWMFTRWSLLSLEMNEIVRELVSYDHTPITETTIERRWEARRCSNKEDSLARCPRSVAPGPLARTRWFGLESFAGAKSYRSEPSAVWT
jgi:hypothetical protein